MVPLLAKQQSYKLMTGKFILMLEQHFQRRIISSPKFVNNISGSRTFPSFQAMVEARIQVTAFMKLFVV